VRNLTLSLPGDVDLPKARLSVAIALFKDGHLALGRAAELACLSYQSFVEELRQRGIPIVKYSEKEWTRDLEYLRVAEPGIEESDS
jgi:predicted HTH domain antitoxin